MGLHLSDRCLQFNPVESETRKRSFWVLRTMDTYVTTLLGLPKIVGDEDLNQKMPSEVDDEFITDRGILPMPNGHISIAAAVNAHTTLIIILAKVVKLIYNPRDELNGPNDSCQVDYAKVIEIEDDLKNWFQRSQNETIITSSTPRRLAYQTILNISDLIFMCRMRLLSRITYSHVQMVLTDHSYTTSLGVQATDRRIRNLTTLTLTLPVSTQMTDLTSYISEQRWKIRSCAQRNEDRLMARPNQVIARDRPQGGFARERQVDQAVANLRERHHCTRGNWRYIHGPHQFEEFYHHLPQYIFECRQCRILAC